MHGLVIAIALLGSMGGESVQPTPVRIAVFNIWELSSTKLNEVGPNGRGLNPQLRSAAETIQRVRPDVLLVNEIDYSGDSPSNAALFSKRYLEVGQAEQEPIVYRHVFDAPVNTGLSSGRDLDKDGKPAGPADAIGYGRYPGQYGMALYSRFPLDRKQVRTFQKLLWKDMPGHLIPDGSSGRPAWYTPEDLEVLRLSSKSHWVVPVVLGETTVHILCAHPTPPVFDGPEDRNGRRTFDEIRLLADMIRGGPSAAYLVDDQGRRGALPPDAAFVVLGDLNAEPFKDKAAYGQTAISQLLELPQLQDTKPQSAGAAVGATPGAPHFAELRTSNFGRIDYALPSANLEVKSSGVFWPAPGDPLHRLVDGEQRASDHRLVWIDLIVPAAPSP